MVGGVGGGPMRGGRVAQLVVSSITLGAGVTLLLDAGLGSDGYSTLVNGMRLAADWPFWSVNLIVAVAFVCLAWARGLRPGPGTVVQPVVVGFVVSLLLPLAPDPTSYAGRGIELAVAFPVLSIGVSGYLASRLGAGPAEAAALAWDPPVPFRWSYSLMQISGALIGWGLGADVGIGTLLVVVVIGPLVDLISRVLFRTSPSTPRKTPERPEPTAESEPVGCR
jgi:uncharacterized membrane protein YczE